MVNIYLSITVFYIKSIRGLFCQQALYGALFFWSTYYILKKYKTSHKLGLFLSLGKQIGGCNAIVPKVNRSVYSQVLLS